MALVRVGSGAHLYALGLLALEQGDTRRAKGWFRELLRQAGRQGFLVEVVNGLEGMAEIPRT